VRSCTGLLGRRRKRPPCTPCLPILCERSPAATRAAVAPSALLFRLHQCRPLVPKGAAACGHAPAGTVRRAETDPKAASLACLIPNSVGTANEAQTSQQPPSARRLS
jgi:hypothetical protein